MNKVLKINSLETCFLLRTSTQINEVNKFNPEKALAKLFGLFKNPCINLTRNSTAVAAWL
jgi:hypothetical protein